MQKNSDDKQFDGQRDGEQLVALFRKHAGTLAVLGLRNFVVAAVAVFVAMKLLSQRFSLIGYAVAAVAAIQVIYRVIIWYYSFCIVTDQRLRYVQRSGLFRQSVLDLNLDSIEMIRYETTGFVAEMIKSGDLIIDSSAGELRIANLKNIKQVYNLLQDIINKGKNQTNEANS